MSVKSTLSLSLSLLAFASSAVAQPTSFQSWFLVSNSVPPSPTPSPPNPSPGDSPAAVLCGCPVSEGEEVVESECPSELPGNDVNECAYFDCTVAKMVTPTCDPAGSGSYCGCQFRCKNGFKSPIANPIEITELGCERPPKGCVGIKFKKVLAGDPVQPVEASREIRNCGGQKRQ